MKRRSDEKNQYMLEHSISTDCTFVVGPEDGETKEFKAHRFLLCNASPVFEKMLTGEMMEARTGHVRVTDLSPNTFQLLLSSIYGKDPKINFQEAQEFTYAANKYQIKLLLENGVTRMGALIEPENIWTAFETADLLQNVRLRKLCIQALQRDTLRCITDPGFMQTSEENVALFLEQDELDVDDEPSLVNIIVHWARHAARQRGLPDDDCGVRAVLEPRLLSLFRFLAMSPQQFILGPGLAGWLNSDEKAAISECLRSEDSVKLLPHLCALTQKRKIITHLTFMNIKPSKILICKRKIIGSQSNVCESGSGCCPQQKNNYYICYHAMLIFRVKSSCQWLGFQCASQCKIDPTRLSAKNPVYHENIITNMYTFEQTLSTDFSKIRIGGKSYEQVVEYNSSIPVMFDKPIPLVTDNWFALEVCYRHPCYGRLGKYLNPDRAQSVCTEAGVKFVFHTKVQSGFHNTYNEGLLESLIFSL